jgi:prolyl 4-hydroxylase
MTAAATGIAELSADLASAEKCDAAGRHGEAIDHLVAGVRNGNVEAFTRLGKRLLVGDRAPLLPNDGAKLIEDASARGGAEAAALLAVLFAVGASHRHDLRAALASLVDAATRGWRPAQAQLRVLAGVPAVTDASGSGAQPDGWQQLAEHVDLTMWQTAPSATDLAVSPLVRSYASFVSGAVCRWLIDKARRSLSRALVYEALIKKVTVHHTRTNSAAMFGLLDTDLVCVLTQTRMAACLGTPFRHFEPMTVLHYGEGEQITEHFDFVDPNVPDYQQEVAQRGQRMVTFLVYLNDDYAAGETEFPRLGVSHRGQSGEGLYFVNALHDGSADVRTLHAGRPPARGEKWIVSQFVRDRAVF